MPGVCHLPASYRDMLDRMKREIRPQDVLVFGSWARGEAHEGSDLDVFVVWDTPLSPAERRVRVREALGSKPCAVDVVVYTPDEVAARRESLGSLVPVILREGLAV